MRFLLPIAGLFFVFIVSGCGFKPVYMSQTGAKNVSVQDALSYIEIPIVPDKIGVDLRNEMVDKLYVRGEPQNPTFKLILSIKSRQIFEAGIAQDATRTREQLRLVVNANLVSANDVKESFFNRDFVSLANYNILASEYATLVAREEAVTRAIEQITDDIMTQLTLYFADNES